MRLEKLLTMNDSEVQGWLIKVHSGKELDTLVTAMAGADEAVSGRVFANMTPRAASVLRDDIRAKQAGNPSESDISKAAARLEKLI